MCATVSVQWLAWSAEAFERARAERKPVLLSITAPWCDSCREMDRTSYADRKVVTLINDRFVPIRVDADRRPDISERYSLGGWPTTAFLTADGQVVGGGTYLSLDRMPAVLEQVVHAFASRGDEIDAHAATAQDRDDPLVEPSSEATLIEAVFATFDREHGGFGTEPKFPLTAPLHLALDLHRETGDSRLADIVVSTLDRMGWGPLHDDVDGGFFRCATKRDWQAPHLEKLLDVNAGLLKIYLDAFEMFDVRRYGDRAQDVIRYIQTWLADPVDGGWSGSQQADGSYYSFSTAEERRRLTAPPIDRVLYAGWNAVMVSAALRAAEVLDDSSMAEFAVKSLERVLLACYRPGEGVAHYFDGAAQVRGLLDDQISMAAACLDAHAATDNIVYEMMAEELSHYALRTMWDAETGGFFDRAPPETDAIGLMRRPLKPFTSNCEAARLLRRLAKTSGEPQFAESAEATLAAMAPLAISQGPLAAHYVLALRSAAASLPSP